MKECEWCGDDFRGEGTTFDKHFFFSENCRDEFRKEVLGETEPLETAEEPHE